jgi:arabinose-5-phosphate isomerase
VLTDEAEALHTAAQRVDAHWARTLELLLENRGHGRRVHLIGLGKSGLVAQKLVATLNSTGTPAHFVHAAEAFHGDLGGIRPHEVCILFSKSGTTAEVVKLMPFLRSLGCPLVALTGNPDSPLAHGADAVLNAAVKAEADGLDLAPTSSTTVQMGIGDALATALMQAANFQPQDFARFHPGGQLGANLTLTVRQRMQPLARVAVCNLHDPLRDVILHMTERPLGAALLLDAHKHLVGIVTDGDLRRALLKTDHLHILTAQEIGSTSPSSTHPDALLHEALATMQHPRPLSVLPVVEASGVCVGLLRLHDIYQRGDA